MNRILQLTTYGMKNIENSLTIDFANATIESGIKKVNTVKGIFGYNGSGKSALVTSIDLYKKIVCNYNYLLQNETIEQLNKLINYRLKEFYINVIFEYNEKSVIKHTLRIKKQDITNDYIIDEEEVSLSIGRTINDNYKVLIRRTSKDIFIDDKYKAFKKYNVKINEYNSIVTEIVKEMIENKINEITINNFDLLEKAIFDVMLFATNINVYLSTSDLHKKYIYGEETLKKIANNNFSEVYVDDEEINKEDYEKYKSENKKLEKFIQIFKPELLKIDLKISEDKDIYHIRKVFCYKEYNVELEFESSGIRQLVKLFTYFMKCARGGIVFIDEIDTNINTGYFKKLIAFFKTYGKGQLVFTTHNVEAMNVLKDQPKSITALGIDNKVDVWVGKGNKSPVNDYLDGFFPNSPMNVEDFDFINIFLGEK